MLSTGTDLFADAPGAIGLGRETCDGADAGGRCNTGIGCVRRGSVADRGAPGLGNGGNAGCEGRAPGAGTGGSWPGTVRTGTTGTACVGTAGCEER